MTEKPDIQDYELIAPIAKGGFGEVWLAENVLGVFHAIKIVKWPESSKEDHEQKLRHYQAEFNGIKAYAPISQKHDGLLDIYHAAIRESEGYYYYVLPLADDLRLGSNIDPDNYSPKTLANYLEASEEGRLSPEESIEIIKQVTFALHQLHGEGVVHRDIKPDNIICVNDRWCLGDIGLVAGQGAESFVGSLGYLAPEGPGKPVADIFSVGKVLYAICTGKTPDSFPDYPTWAFANRAEQNEFQEVNKIFCKACEFAPKNRYQNTLKLIEALQATDEPTYASQKHPSFALKIGFALAVSLFSIILIFALKDGPSSSEPELFTKKPVEEAAATKKRKEEAAATKKREEKAADAKKREEKAADAKKREEKAADAKKKEEQLQLQIATLQRQLELAKAERNKITEELDQLQLREKLGTLLWKFETGDQVRTSPAIGSDGIVYVGSMDRKVYALDGKSGAEKWEFVTGGGVGSLAIGSDGTVYVGSDKLYSLDGKTGFVEWEFLTGGGVVSLAIGSDGTVYVGSDKLYSLDGKTGFKQWEFVTGGSLAIGCDGTVYVGSDKLYSLNGKTGFKQWEFEPAGFRVSSSPTIGSDGTVYVGSKAGKVYALDGKTGAKKWEFETDFFDASSPAIGADGTVYVGSFGEKVYALDGKSGAKKWSFKTGGRMTSSPVIGSDGTVYIGSWGTEVNAIKTDSKGPAKSPWPMSGRNAKHTGRVPRGSLGKRKPWTHGVNIFSIDRIYPGKRPTVIQKVFGEPDKIQRTSWGYTCLNIADNKGNKYTVVWFDFEKGVVKKMRFYK